MSENPPAFPSGEYEEPSSFDAGNIAQWVEQLREVPQRARLSVEGLNDEQLDTRYRNWTIRQIIHHIVDSHINCYVRFKWALSEQEPTIKAYDETGWSQIADAMTAPLESSLVLLDGLHQRWCEMVERLSEEQLQRGFFHPELEKVVRLREALPAYVWHSNHHLSQIQWVRDKHGWN